MPAKSEAQRRLMAACAHGAHYKKCPAGMSKAKMREFGFKSHMPKGATQSPKGNLGNKSDQEYWVQRHFKESGHVLDAGEAFGSHVLDPGKQGSADYGTKATH